MHAEFSIKTTCCIEAKEILTEVISASSDISER